MDPETAPVKAEAGGSGERPAEERTQQQEAEQKQEQHVEVREKQQQQQQQQEGEHATTTTTEPPRAAHIPLRDSKGWDGKLRIDKSEGKSAVLANPEALSDAEHSDEEAAGPAPEVIAADEDLLDEYSESEDDINLVHCRIQSIPALRLERFRQVRTLCLRQNQITAIELPAQLAATLTELDLYDNLIAHVRGLEPFTELTTLDLSFNKIKHVKRIEHLTKLKELFFVQNKISRIEGLDGLTELRNLELGANRIREIEGLESLTKLEELWLGKNKITEIKGLNTLTNLRVLAMPSNRLTHLSGLDSLTNLEELHVSHNLLKEISGLEHNTNLRVIDISANKDIAHLENLSHLRRLEELWASNCGLADFGEVERELRDKEHLETVYFEGNPLQTRQPALYRNKVRLALPQIRQIDATYVTVS